MKYRLPAIFAATLLIALSHHMAFGQNAEKFEFKSVDPCESKDTSAPPEAFVACKIGGAAEVPLMVSAACGNIKTPQVAKLKLKVEVFAGGIVKSAEIVESNVSDPWFTWRVTQNVYSLKFPSIKKDSAFDSVQVNLDLNDISRRIRIYNCKDLYVGGGR